MINNLKQLIYSDLDQLNDQQFLQIFKAIFAEQIDEKTIKDFLISLNNYNLPTQAFIGAVNALRTQMITIEAPQNCLDVCGTGGDNLNTLNISTAVSIVVASAGVCVAKHGNKAISSQSGSADIFMELGVEILTDKNLIEKNLQQKNLAFLYAVFFHPALKKLAPIRKELATPTIFNFLGPLLNPAQTNLQLIGTSRLNTMSKIAEVIATNSRNHAFIVHGFEGIDEISITNNSYLVEVKDGKILPTQIINPLDYNFSLSKLTDIQGKDPKYNASKLMAMLNGEISPYRDIVVLNSAFGLLLAKKVKSVFQGIILAQNLIDQKTALQKLNEIKKVES